MADPKMLTKTSYDELNVAFDLSEALASGDTISAAAVTVLDADDADQAAMVSGSASISGTTVTQKIVGGTEPNYYTCRLRTETAGGEKFQDSILILVKDAIATAVTGNWATVEEANAYFATRLGAADYWTTDVEKEAALTTAQNQIEFSNKFSIPDSPTATQTANMKKAAYEQALFLLIDEGSGRRAALLAQGVIKADLVGETYRGAAGGEIPIAPLAAGALRGLAKASKGAYVIDVSDEEDD